MSHAAEIARVYKALADETRLRVLLLLAELGELCVCDIEAALEITQSKTSRHLRVLKEARLVSDRRDGAWVHYRLDDDPSEIGREAIAVLRRTLGQSAEGRRDVARARRVRRHCE